jgi:paraquat-inducible protein B
VLYDSHESTSQPLYTRKITYVLYFDESVRGLDIGAPVEFRGVRVGTVRDLKAEFDTRTNQIRIPVLIDIEPDRVPRADGNEQTPTLEETKQRIDRLVERGIRAQLRTGNLLTGKRFVALDFYPNTPITLVDAKNGYPQLPTTPTVLGAVEDAATDLMTKLQKLPIEQIAQNLLAASEGLNHLMNDQELQKTVRTANTTLEAFRELAEDIDRNVIPNARQTLAGLDESSPIYLSVVNTLDELSMTARSLRVFAEYLERHPEALLRGKQ